MAGRRGSGYAGQSVLPQGPGGGSASGNLYIADWLNSRVRVVTPDGNIYTVAGNGAYAYYGDGGPATSAALRFPWGLGRRLRREGVRGGRRKQRRSVCSRRSRWSPLRRPRCPKSTAGGVVSLSAFGGFSSVAPGSWIEIHGSNLATHTRPWTSADFHGCPGPHLARWNLGHHRRPAGVYLLHQPESNQRADPVGRGRWVRRKSA